MRVPQRAAALLLLVLGCEEAARTEILVAIDTDLEVPTDLDAVRVDMVGPAGQLRRTMGFLVDEIDLPATVGMVHRDGALGPVQVTVTGSRSGRDVIQRLAVVDFVEGETRVLFVMLGRECLDVACPPEQTCDPFRMGCREVRVGPEELLQWGGSIDRHDGGTDGAVDACTALAETCNGADEDCDGTNDEDFDLESDMTNCGECGNVCATAPPNGSAACVSGQCELRCDLGWADCDREASNGCEASLATAATCGSCTTSCDDPTPLCESNGTERSCVASCMGGRTACGDTCVDVETDPLHCGGCGIACPSAAGSSPTCVARTCGIACDSGYGNCDGMMSTGCETPVTTTSNCGSCGNACSLANAMESCVMGACAVAGCEPPYGNCDSSAANGCEVDLSTTATACGTCTTACGAAPSNAMRRCSGGACVNLCNAGFGDCDSNETNGCEASLSTPETCGSCGIRCVAPSPLCASGMGGYSCVGSCEPPSTMCASGCTDTTSDPANCMTCGNACAPAPQASPTCSGGACGLACNSGFGDCNATMSDGCEATLSSTTNCGACGTACTPANASGTCSTGSCRIAACDAGWLDCDTSPGNGCETDRNGLMNCGGCGVVCPTAGPNVMSATCTTGNCALVCQPGFGNCDGMPATGCETSLSTLTNCGSCGASCAPPNATGACTAGACVVSSCNAGWGDCDMSPGNGCEVDTNTRRQHCGTCGNDCDAGNHCCAGVCNDRPC